MFDISQDYWNDKEVEGEKDIFRTYLIENSGEVLRPDHKEALNSFRALFVGAKPVNHFYCGPLGKVSCHGIAFYL